MQTIFIAALAAQQHSSSSSARRVDAAFYHPSDKWTHFKACLESACYNRPFATGI